MVATISADIVRSTTMVTEDLFFLRDKLLRLLDAIGDNHPGFWARIVRGDSIECVVPQYSDSLRIGFSAIIHVLFVEMMCGKKKMCVDVWQLGYKSVTLQTDCSRRFNYV